ncbi:MAG: L,D-transpeptidase [Deltaproteobacteria bacterium]|nr:L,D-transpeptidase [Deltaproteobacteria bacterium]
MVRELAQAGFSIVRTGEEYQAPFVEIAAPPGLAIYTLCRRVPSLNARFFEARDKIAAFNNLNPFFVRHDEGRPHHFRLPTIKIPLDFTRDPVIFPAYQEGLAAYPQYLLIDIGKCYLALYERGVLVRVYPISPGALNHGNRSRTPLVRFTIQSKAEHKWSSIYDAWMPYSLQVHGPYFIHGGVLPGEPDSKGCIRMFTDHARELFNLVEVGTHGRIVRSGPVAPPPGGTHLAGSR